MGRLAQKLKGGLRTALKIGAVGAGLAGAYLATKSAKQGKDALETGVSNAQVLGQEAVAGGQAVVGAGVLGGQSEAKKQAEKLGVLTNLGLQGENLSEITKAQKEQAVAPTLPPVNPNTLKDKGRSGGFGGGSNPLSDDDVAQAVRMANCSQKYGGSGIRYRRCLKTGK